MDVEPESGYGPGTYDFFFSELSKYRCTGVKSGFSEFGRYWGVICEHDDDKTKNKAQYQIQISGTPNPVWPILGCKFLCERDDDKTKDKVQFRGYWFILARSDYLKPYAPESPR